MNFFKAPPITLFLPLALFISLTVVAQPQLRPPGVQGSTRTADLDPNNRDLRFETVQHNFGKITIGGKAVPYEFHFTNVGDEPITITDVKTSCGCTAPSWPKEPIDPGYGSAIILSFNPGTMGSFTKTARVYWGEEDNPPIRLVVKGKVVPSTDVEANSPEPIDTNKEPVITKSRDLPKSNSTERTMSEAEIKAVFEERKTAMEERKRRLAMVEKLKASEKTKDPEKDPLKEVMKADAEAAALKAKLEELKKKSLEMETKAPGEKAKASETAVPENPEKEKPATQSKPIPNIFDL